MEKKISIVHIIPSLALAGAEKLLVDIVCRIDKDKFKLSVISLRAPNEFKKELENFGIDFYVIGARSKMDFLAIFKIAKILKKIGPDIVHTHLFSADIFGGFAAHLAGVKKLISTQHNINKSEGLFKHYLYRVMYKKYSRILCVSEAVKKYCLGQKLCSSSKLKIIHNGVDYDEFFLKRNYALRDPVVVGSIGRLSGQKGFDIAINAVSKFLEEGINLVYYIAGEGELKKQLNSLIIKNNLENNVKLLGSTKNVSNFLEKVDIYIQPSNWEGFGISIIEAGANGLPVIASKVDGIEDIITDKVNGLLFNRGDILGLAGLIKRLVENSEERVRLGNKLQKDVENKFNINKTEKKYEQAYRELVGSDYKQFKQSE